MRPTLNGVPDRVSADLRAKQHREDHFVPEEFDWTNEDHVRAILMKHQHLLIKPLMGLLDSYREIDQAERCFGVDHKKAVGWLMPDLLSLREACAILFAERDK